MRPIGGSEAEIDWESTGAISMIVSIRYGASSSHDGQSGPLVIVFCGCPDRGRAIDVMMVVMMQPHNYIDPEGGNQRMQQEEEV